MATTEIVLRVAMPTVVTEDRRTWTEVITIPLSIAILLPLIVVLAIVVILPLVLLPLLTLARRPGGMSRGRQGREDKHH